MVDPRTVIPGIIDSTKVLTFTTLEAIKNHYCEGEAESVSQVLAMGGITNYTIHEQRITGLDSIMGWLLNPVVQGILIILIFAGIYFELQTPGVGFPIILAIIAAAVYFAPLYLEGLAENWEIIMVTSLLYFSLLQRYLFDSIIGKGLHYPFPIWQIVRNIL